MVHKKTDVKITEQSLEMKGLAKDIFLRWQHLVGARGIWNQHWQEIAEFVIPRRGGFTSTQIPGEKKMNRVFDSTAIWANEQLAAALHGMLTNPSQRWFQYRTTDPRLMDFQEVRVWLHEVENIIYDVFSTPEANFNSQVHELYLDIVAFGTALMYIEETPGVGPGLRYRTLYLGESWVSEGKNGIIDTLYRLLKISARNAYNTWGDNAGSTIANLAAKKPDELVDIIWEVRPRKERDVNRRDALNKAWSSTYVTVKDRWVINESGFDDFPILSPRWTKVIGETYGRSPAMVALPDIKMLNEMSRTTIRAAQKAVDPPLLVPDDAAILPVRTTPSGLNFFRAGTTDKIEPLKMGGDVGLGLEMEDQRRSAILRAFFLDQLKLQKEKVEMTRFEAEVRQQENLRQLSPTIGRIEMEFLDLIIENTFVIKAKQRGLPPPPQVLVDADAELKVEYVSPIARAQRSQEATAVMQAMDMIGPIAVFEPAVLDNFDGDEIARGTQEWFGLPPKIMKSIAKRDQVRAAKAKIAANQQQQDEAIVSAEQTSKILKAQNSKK